MNPITVLRDQRKNLPISLTKDECSGRTYIVTGANSGLGYECAKHLVRMQSARVILAVRNIKAGEEAKRSIESSADVISANNTNKTGETTKIDIWQLDLVSFDSVKAFAVRVINDLPRVDGVIQNAAVGLGQWKEGEQGWDVNMTVNLISTMLLTVLLIPHLRKLGKHFNTVPRIAVIGTEGAFWSAGRDPMMMMDQQNMLLDIADKKKWESSVEKFYPFSKLLLYFSIQQLATSTSPVDEFGFIICYVNPGLCYTNLNRNANPLLKLQISIARTIMGRTAEMGSRTLIHGVAAGKECHGKYLSGCELKE